MLRFPTVGVRIELLVVVSQSPGEGTMLLRAARGAGYNATRFARHFGCCLRCLERALKAQAGCSPKHFLATLRAVEAALYILHGQTVKEAAFAFGYHDGAHLSRALKAHAGALPSELAAIHRSNGAGGSSPAPCMLEQKVGFIQRAGVALEEIKRQREQQSPSTAL